MAISYYPIQKIEVDGEKIPLIQNGSLSLNVPQKAIYGLDKPTAYKNLQIEPAIGTINFSYIMSNQSVGSILGVSNLASTLSDITVGKLCRIYSNGTHTIKNSFLTSYTVKGSIGGLIECDVEYQGYDISFNSGGNQTPGSVTDATVFTPNQITLNLAGISRCQSFTFSLDISRENVTKLGETLPVASILTKSPIVKIDAEVLLNTDNINLIPNTNYDLSINCNTKTYSVQQIKLVNMSVNTSKDGVSIASISFSKELEDFSKIVIPS